MASSSQGVFIGRGRSQMSGTRVAALCREQRRWAHTSSKISVRFDGFASRKVVLFASPWHSRMIWKWNQVFAGGSSAAAWGASEGLGSACAKDEVAESSAMTDHQRGRSIKSISIVINGAASQPKLRCSMALNSHPPTEEPSVWPMPEAAASPPMATPSFRGDAPAAR